MSDEFLFDSERQQQKADRKRKLLPFLVLAGVLLLAVIVALLLRGSKGEIHTGGEQTDYPFRWSLKSDGSVELTVPHEDAPESRWVLKDGEESLPALRVTREEGENDGTVFLLHPETEGRALFTLTLTGQGENAAKSYEMKLLAEVTPGEKGLSAALLNASGVRCQAELRGGEDSENPYRLYTDEDGVLILSVEIASEYETDWDYEILSGEESLELLGVLSEEDRVNAYLEAGEAPGAAELVLRSVNAAAEIRLSLEAKADGSLWVLSHEASYGEKPSHEPMASEDLHKYDREEENPGETAPTGPEGDLAPHSETETPADSTAADEAETESEAAPVR